MTVSIGNYYTYLAFSDYYAGKTEYYPDTKDFIHLLLILISRSLVIAIKYALYSDEQLDLMTKIKQSYHLLSFNLVGFISLNAGNPKSQMKFIENTMESLGIENETFNVNIFKDQKKYKIKNYDLLYNRLKSEKEMI